MHRIVYTLDPRRVLVLLFIPPIVVLPGLSLLSRLLSIDFGDLVFYLTIGTCFGWILLNFNSRTSPRSGETRSALVRESEYLTAVGSSSDAQLRTMATVLLALTGTVVLGWVFLVAS